MASSSSLRQPRDSPSSLAENYKEAVMGSTNTAKAGPGKGPLGPSTW